MVLDEDLIGLSAAAFVGGLAMAAGFFWQKLDMFSVIIRVGVTSVVTYITVFLFVKYILHTLFVEFGPPEGEEIEGESEEETETNGETGSEDDQTGEEK